MRSIPALRECIYEKVNECLSNIYSIDKIIYVDLKKIKLEEVREEIDNISLSYIQKGIEIYNEKSQILIKKIEIVNYLVDKNNECLEKYNYLKEYI